MTAIQTSGAHSFPHFDLARLTREDAVVIGQLIRSTAEPAHTASEAAERIIDFLYRCLKSGGEPSAVAQQKSGTALLRCFLTQPFSALPLDAFTAARRALPSISGDTACLTLLATRGVEDNWNSPQTSAGHRAIPLANVAMIERAPMIARLIAELGVTPEEVMHPSADLLLDQPNRSFNVFYVERAAGSEFIPAQKGFVLPYDVQSVVGMGGLLASGELFAVVLFSRVSISRAVAELFRTIALSVKLALLPYDENHIF